jgi:4-hydroxyphenylpyruvate dioxygenase
VPAPSARSAPGSSAPTRTRSPAATIDHVALTQHRHGFDEAALFYSSVLGLTLRESVELADPRGLLHSRAVTNADETLCLALNCAPHPTHDDQHGQHGQHIAFAVPDILASARRLCAFGIGTLAIPANYYDDLEARFVLPEKTLAQYRELGILYDRDESGEFLHCYTASVGRVFFEVVQRIDGYRGYGASNAAVRLAAQHNRTVTAGR